MERNGTTYAPEQPVTLPDMCFSTHPATGALIIIKRGEVGYSDCGFSTEDEDQNRRTADRMNVQAGNTKQQIAAMEAGSRFGWNVPAANPNRYDFHGNPLPERDQKRASVQPQLLGKARQQRDAHATKKRIHSEQER